MPRRILLLITDLEIGGTPTVVREIATRLHAPAEGVEIEVACLSKWGPVADQLRDSGIHVTALGARSPAAFLAIVWKLIRLVRARKFDTVFSFLLHANAVAAAASLFCPRPGDFSSNRPGDSSSNGPGDFSSNRPGDSLSPRPGESSSPRPGDSSGPGVRFIQSIQTTQPRPRWHWWLQRMVQHAAEAIIVPSPSAAQAAHDRCDIALHRITIIANAIDPADFPRSPIPGQSPTPYPIGFIGRLDPVKRVDRLLAEVALIQRIRPGSVHLHVFGDGIERGHLLREIDRLGLGDTVTLHGTIARPQEGLEQIGLLILRSEAEGFGLVLIEAMAAGVPVIGTNVPGIRDVVTHEKNGLLVSFASAPEMAAAILRIVEDPPLRRRLIAEGLASAHAHFSWPSVLPQYRALLHLSPLPPTEL